MKNQCIIKCNSASKLNGCIQREQSKIILALPTNNSIMEVEKTLASGFSCVNTRLSFDTEILMPNSAEVDYRKMNIDESFKAYRRDDFLDRSIITNILKMGENNQYGF